MSDYFKTPKSWYYVGATKNFKKGRPYEFKILNRSFVVYRKENNKLVAMRSACSHMGANLSKGKVINDRIVCPFHAWEYDENGTCVNIPALGCEKFEEKRVQTFPIIERFGHIFLFNSESANFSLPFFDNLEKDNVISGERFEIFQDAAWYWISANAFDVPHFVHVHNREPYREPLIEEGQYHSKITHFYKIKPQKLFIDFIIKKFIGDKARLEFSVYAGNFVLASTYLGPIENHMMIMIEPTGQGTSKSNIVIFRNKSKLPLLDRLFLKVQSYFTKKFFEVEAQEIKGVRISPKALHSSDTFLKTYFHWLEGIV